MRRRISFFWSWMIVPPTRSFSQNIHVAAGNPNLRACHEDSISHQGRVVDSRFIHYLDTSGHMYWFLLRTNQSVWSIAWIARRLVQSLCLSFRTSCFFVVVVEETSGSTDRSARYQVPGILQGTGWEIFTIKSRRGSIVKDIFFRGYVFFFFSFHFR